MIEPRARVVSFEDADFGDMRIQVIKASTVFPELLADGTELTTVADVLAALRESAPKKIEGEMGLARFVITEFLDAFERDQGSAT